jgi:hypothetical protein
VQAVSDPLFKGFGRLHDFFKKGSGAPTRQCEAVIP